MLFQAVVLFLVVACSSSDDASSIFGPSVSTEAGTPDGGPASADASLDAPNDTATPDASRDADAASEDGGGDALVPTLTLRAGIPGGDGTLDGSGADARFFRPYSVAADIAGNVYVADQGNNTIRKITTAGVVTTLAGSARVAGSADGAGAAALFNGPSGIAVDSAGNVIVADTVNGTIRKITPAGEVTTLAGTAGVMGSSDGTGAACRRPRLVREC